MPVRNGIYQPDVYLKNGTSSRSYTYILYTGATMKTEPLYRRPLNPKQLAILHILARFRFATTDLIAKTLATTDKNTINRRLKILVGQEYVSRKYEPQYRLRAQHESFCL